MFRIFYTQPQIERLHLHLLHQAALEFYEILRCAAAEDPTLDNLSIMDYTIYQNHAKHAKCTRFAK